LFVGTKQSVSARRYRVKKELPIVRLLSTPSENSMSKPEIAAKSPFAVTVEKGKDYYWCSCGKSKSQPFCDGSHKGSEFAPVKYTADESKAVYFCGCKHSANGALCDGSHKAL
jgi:CDGSH-type Zn-finger protein